MAFRSDELKGSTATYPDDGAVRGGSKYEDWYYFTGLKISLRLGAGGICNKRAQSWKELSPYSKTRCPIRVW